MSKYYKIILTVIALVLICILGKIYLLPATAVESVCGSRWDPCYVRVLDTVDVHVKNN